MSLLSANDLKRHGVTAIEKAMQDEGTDQVTISVRGEARYVVLSIDEYNAFREFELDRAIRESEQALASGDFEVIIDVDEYAERLRKELAEDA